MPKSKDFDKEDGSMPKKPRPILHRVNEVFALLFYTIWILIGAFFILIIVSQIKQGALNTVFGNQTSQTREAQASTETNLPGVGKVNIACVQESLSQETIEKLVVEGNASTLTPDEKSKLDPCIVEADDSSPSPAS